MSSIGQKTRPTVGRLEGSFQLGNLFRFSTIGWHTPDSSVNVRRVKNCFARPSTPSSIVGGREYLWRTAGNIDPLNLLIGEKSNRFSVRGPKWKLSVLRARKRLCLSLSHRPQEQHSLAFRCAYEHHVASIWRERRRPG